MGRYCSEHGHTLTDRTIIMAQNGRHGLRGISARNPSEFEAYQDDDDNLTYTVDMASYLGSATISSVTRVPYGLTVGNASNTTTQLSQRLKGFGYVDIKVSLSSGDTEQFRIHIVPRVPTQITGAQDYIEVPVATTSTSDPTTSDDSTRNFVPGNVWINTATENVFDCISNAVGAARWRHRPRVWQSGETATVGATTNETALATITLPGGTLGANGALLIETFWTLNSSVDNKTLRIRLGGIAGTAFLQAVLTTAGTTYRDLRTIWNANAPNAQKGVPLGTATAGGIGFTGGAETTGTIDTAADKTLVISGEKQTAGDTLSLRAYTVTLTRPDIA
jgi:hypothetical protein